MGIWNLLFKRKKYKKPASFFSLYNIKQVLQSKTRQFLDTIDILAPEEYIGEQAIYRLNQVAKKSPECLGKDGCKICGCDPVDEVWSDGPCKNEDSPCFGKMMSKVEWEFYKKDNNIIIERHA